MTAEEIRAAYTRLYEDLSEQSKGKMAISDAIALFGTAVSSEIAAQLAELNAALANCFSLRS